LYFFIQLRLTPTPTLFPYTTLFRSDLIACYGAAMRRLCAVYARGLHDREDLFQNIFLAVWKALPSYRGDATDRTWVYSIAQSSRSEEHTSELQSRGHLVCRHLLEKK